MADSPQPVVARNATVGDTPLVRTKLSPPRLPGTSVALERHSQWLPVVLKHAFCLVRAPSGYGKSTMCASWYRELASAGHAVAWVSFDHEDDDPSQAIRYILGAMQGCGVRNIPVWDGLTPPAALAGALVNAIDIHDGEVILFLDDVDRLHESRVQQFLGFVLLHPPTNLHIVAACQRHPELPLTRLAALGLSVSIGQDALELSDEEAVALLESEPAIVDFENIRRLNKAMAGWVTGLRIGSAALRNNSDALLDIGLPSQAIHWLDDYLDENIFQHLPPSTQHFLKRCAIIERLEPSLCETLTGEASAATLLNWLADQNLFIQRFDDASTEFRIHPVFRRFLRSRLEQEGAEELGTLHVKASRWLASHGRTSEAIDHAIEAGATNLAAELIDNAAMKAIERSDILTLLRWIDRLPPEIVESWPSLRIGQAWALTLALRGTARDAIEALRRNANAQANADLLKEMAGIEAIYLSIYEDRYEQVATAGRAFLESNQDDCSFAARAVRNALAFSEIVRGRFETVHDIVRPAQLCAMREEQLFTTAYRWTIIGLSYRGQGELAEAERTFATGLAQVDADGGRQSASSSLIAPLLARALYERGEIDAAHNLLAERLAIIDEVAFHESVTDAYIVANRIAALRGGGGEAVPAIERAELIGHERGWRRLLAHCLFERARLGLPFTTDPVGLAPDSCLEGELDPLSLDVRTRVIVAKASAMRAIRLGEPAAAHLAIVDRFADRTRSYSLKLELALMRHLDGRRPLGDASPDRDILAAAVARGFGRTIVDIFQAVDEARLVSLCLPDPRLQSLLSLLRDHNQEPEVPVVDPNLFSVLTSREIDVLVGVARGESNKEIARRLHLTPETVKWHLKNVMRKLDVDSRAAAVQRAEHFGFSM